MLDDLESAGLVDDRAYARAWVDSRHRSRGLSRARLRRELTERGIAGDVADEALSALTPDDDRATAMALARAWVGRHGMEGDRDRARLFAHLARRGYGPGVVAATVREVGGGNIVDVASDWDDG